MERTQNDNYEKIISVIVCVAAMSSCATIFSGSKSCVTFASDDGAYIDEVDLTIDGQKHRHVMLPYKTKIRRGFKPTKVHAEAPGYTSNDIVVSKRFNGTSAINLFNPIAWGIDAATGAMMKPEYKNYTLHPERSAATTQPDNYVEKLEVVCEQPVSRDNAGETDLERTIIRWYFDSEPRGARIFWRVISSVPAEVKNTNETYLMTTPYEETRSFNILGLTYENSRDVVIESKVRKKGYEDQVKRFNVRQAIDQQEISGFFDLVKQEEE